MDYVQQVTTALQDNQFVDVRIVSIVLEVQIKALVLVDVLVDTTVSVVKTNDCVLQVHGVLQDQLIQQVLVFVLLVHIVVLVINEEVVVWDRSVLKVLLVIINVLVVHIVLIHPLNITVHLVDTVQYWVQHHQ